MNKQDFLKVVTRNHFFNQHSKVLVAVSGGKDSLNLFHLLFECQNELKIELGMIHVNHQQRPESIQEEDYLKKLANQLEIPIYVSHFSGEFSESKARKFRYDFFKEIMGKFNFTALVTAHHADDQAETIFMRILRGSRLRHLAGIHPKQPFAKGELIRPLLSFKKSDLDDIFHFEDSSNAENTYLRNRIRNSYIPLLEKENPKISDALILLGQETETVFQAIHDLTKEIDITNCQQFLEQSEAVQTVLLQEYLENFPNLELTKAQFNEVLHILRNKNNYHNLLKNDYYLLKDEKCFSITKIKPQTDERLPELVIESEGVYYYGKFVLGYNIPIKEPKQILYFQKEAPIRIRPRRAGDKLLINGVYKKVRRYFIDQKIPKKQRDQSVIIEQSGNIYGIANIVVSDLSKSAKNDTINATLYIKMKE